MGQASVSYINKIIEFQQLAVAPAQFITDGDQHQILITVSGSGV